MKATLLTSSLYKWHSISYVADVFNLDKSKHFILFAKIITSPLQSATSELVPDCTNVYFENMQYKLSIDSCLSGKNTEEIIEKLKMSSFIIRKVLSKKIVMKFLPKLFFVKDDSFDYAEKIENLIKQTNK